jgi:hypothetical protein
MKFSIRDLFLVTLIVAILMGWWLDRSSSRKELQRVQLLLALEEDTNKLLESVAESHADAAKVQADYDAFVDDVKRAHEATRDWDYRRLDAPEGNLLGPPLPKPSEPVQFRPSREYEVQHAKPDDRCDTGTAVAGGRVVTLAAV